MPYSEDERRFARSVMTVKKTFPVMMQEIAAKYLPATKAYNEMKKNPSFFSKITRAQKDALESMAYSGYSQLDESSMLLLIRALNIVIPSKGWNGIPSRNDLSIGADMERLGKLRNGLLHRTSPILSETEQADFFSEVEAVAKRVDTELNDFTTKKFKNMVFECKTGSLDDQTTQKYTSLLKEMEWKEMSTTLIGRILVKFLTGKSIDEGIEMAQQHGHDLSGNRWVRMVIEDIVDPEKAAQRLNLLKDAIKGDIRIENMDTGSLILYLRVRKNAFKSRKTLKEAFENFVKQILPKLSDLIKEDHLDSFISIDHLKEINLFTETDEWKYLRSTTIPHLRQVEGELDSAGNRIRNLRRRRNASLGLGLIGLFAAPFTGGTSLGLTVTAIAAGGVVVGLGVLIFETYIEKEIMRKAEESIFQDRMGTSFLRERVTFYKYADSPEMQEFARGLASAFPDTIIINIDNSLKTFIQSFVNTEVGSVFDAKAQVATLRSKLEQELKRVEQMESVYF